MKIWLIGASFDTANRGVCALAESSIACILGQWPSAKVIIRCLRDGEPYQITVNGKIHSVERKGLWAGKNILKPQNIYSLLFYALSVKLIPSHWQLEKLKKNGYFKSIVEADLVFDITAGDSFSDIYGIVRLLHHALLKSLFMLCDVPYILLPQTYGPYKSRLAQFIARKILKNTAIIYSRDQQGLSVINNLLGNLSQKKTIKFSPDVAFVLKPEAVDNSMCQQLQAIKDKGKTLVGINISGLLYNSEEKRQSFNINHDYRSLMLEIVELFLKKADVNVILVSHVYAKPNHFESDPDACYAIYQQLTEQYPDKLFLATDQLDHKQIKYLIGLTDFFMGSRMHSCIAALSQQIPTIGLAYSDKFLGVFDSVGAADSVIDLRQDSQAKIIQAVVQAYEQKEQTKTALNQRIPEVKAQVLGMFKGVEETIL